MSPPRRRVGMRERRAGLVHARVCAKREDFGDATGARTFLSAATPEYSTGSERSKALVPSDVAADKNVRAPLWFRLRRLRDSAPYQPDVTEAFHGKDFSCVTLLETCGTVSFSDHEGSH